jgi:hypothetical protein
MPYGAARVFCVRIAASRTARSFQQRHCRVNEAGVRIVLFEKQWILKKT